MNEIFIDWLTDDRPCWFVCVRTPSVTSDFVWDSFENAKNWALKDFTQGSLSVEVYKVSLSNVEKKELELQCWEDVASQCAMDNIGLARPLLLATCDPNEGRSTYGEKYEMLPHQEICKRLEGLKPDSIPAKSVFDIKEIVGEIKILFVANLGKDYDTPTPVEVNIPVSDIDFKQDPDSWFYCYDYGKDADGLPITFEIWGTQDAFGNPRLSGPVLMKDGDVLDRPHFGVNVITDGDISEQIDKITILPDKREIADDSEDHLLRMRYPL